METQFPRQYESERALLATCLYDAKLADEITDNLRPEHFFSPMNGRVYRAIVKLLDNGQPLEAPAVVAEMQSESGGKENGERSYLFKLMDEPLAVNTGHYIGLLKEAHRKRIIIHAADKAARAASSSVESAQILGTLQNDIFSIESNGLHVADVSFGELVNGAIEGIEDAQQGTAGGIKTGYYRLDRQIVAMQRGSLNILCARPGMGKTALAMQIAHNAAGEGHGVGFFSMEMTREQLALRAACAVAGVEYNRALSGRMNTEEWTRIMDARGKLQGLPIHIDDSPGLHIVEIGRKARRWKRVHDIGLLVVDHMQLARSDNPRDRVLMLTEISAGLKAVAKELNIPVLALCQLNREVEKRPDRRPQLSDLRDSGAIEQDADLVVGIYRGAYYFEDANPAEAELLILKQRNGQQCRIKVGWRGASMQFFNPIQT